MSVNHKLSPATLSAVVGDNIKRVRKLRGMNQTELAHSLEMEQSALSRIEKGQNAFTPTALARAAEAFDCEPWQLLKPGFDGRTEGPASDQIRGADILSKDFKENPTARDVGTLVDRFLEAPPDHRAMVMAILFEDASLAASFDWSALELRLVKGK